MQKITIEHKCDRCGYVEAYIRGKDPDDAMIFEKVYVAVGNNGAWGDDHRRLAYWCMTCLKATRLWIDKEEENKHPAAGPIPVPPTLEELIREIVREELPE